MYRIIFYINFQLNYFYFNKRHIIFKYLNNQFHLQKFCYLIILNLIKFILWNINNIIINIIINNLGLFYLLYILFKNILMIYIFKKQIFLYYNYNYNNFIFILNFKINFNQFINKCFNKKFNFFIIFIYPNYYDFNILLIINIYLLLELIYLK